MWPLNWFQIGGGAIAAFTLSWMLHSLDVNRIEANQREATQEQIATDTKACTKDKKTTEDVNNETIKRNQTLAARLAKLNKLQPQRCIPLPATNTASGDHAATGDKGLPRTDGIAAYAFFDYAGDAERVGIALDECQAFIKKERE